MVNLVEAFNAGLDGIITVKGKYLQQTVSLAIFSCSVFYSIVV